MEKVAHPPLLIINRLGGVKLNQSRDRVVCSNGGVQRLRSPPFRARNSRYQRLREGVGPPLPSLEPRTRNRSEIEEEGKRAKRRDSKMARNFLS